MVFFLKITDIWRKPQDFWFVDFFLEISKIHSLVWIFLWIFNGFEFVLKMLKTLFYQKLPSEAFFYHRMVSCAPKKSIDSALWM
jgi:hypothetical protein